MNESGSPKRNLKTIEQSAPNGLLPTYENSWAVLVGIDRYQHFAHLKNAVTDATGVAELLVTRLDFPQENVFFALEPMPDLDRLPYLLADNARSAAKADIEELLLTILPEKTGANDRVLVFYAGHGDQRRAAGENDRSAAYLIPADALPGKWSSYIDWESIRRAGDDFCRAKHIFYILDACYSGIVNTRDASEPPRDIRDALTTRARQALAAGTQRQVVADAGRGGHSPFTWHLIQGLRGDAAGPENRAETAAISAHDLIGYVRRKVAEEDGADQTPSGGSIAGHGGGDFVFTSPLIGFSGKEHLQLGENLLYMGLHSAESACFESAARNLAEAIKLKSLARENTADAEEALGRVLSYKDSDDSLSHLKKAALHGRKSAQLYLGLAHARRNEIDAACRALESFTADLPAHPEASWVAAYARQLQQTGGRRAYALLVGIDKYPEGSPLRGCVNDVLLMKSLLEEVYGFEPANIRTLIDAEATAEKITTELERLATAVLAQDTVVFFFSGHGSYVPALNSSFSKDGLWYALVPYDYLSKLITEPQLHELLTRIPSQDKLFIASAAHVCPGSNTWKKGAGYRFFSGCRRKEYDYETEIDGKVFGAFVYHLFESIRKLGGQGSQPIAREVLQIVRNTLIKASHPQTPQYFGNPNERLLPEMPRGHQPDYLALQEFGERLEYSELDAGAVETWQARLDALGDVLHPSAWLSCARAWLSQKGTSQAIACGEKLLQIPGCDQLEAHLVLCEALLTGGEPEPALRSAELLKEWVPRLHGEALLQVLSHLSRPRRRALLVGISRYPKGIGVHPQGALADVHAIRSQLVERCGFRDHEVELIADRRATHDHVLKRFENLVQHGRTEPALFYFSGLGTNTDSGPGIVMADASKRPTIIGLPELAEISRQAPTNLVAVFDAGWAYFEQPVAESMAAMRVFIPEDKRGEDQPGRPRGAKNQLRNVDELPQIGLATICSSSITWIYQQRPDSVEPVAPSSRKKKGAGRNAEGVLTEALIQALNKSTPLKTTYADWIQAAARVAPYAHLKHAKARLFANVVLEQQALSILQQLKNRRLYDTAELLQRLTDLRRGRDPDSYLNLAVAHLLCDRLEDARKAVEIAMSFRQQPSTDSTLAVPTGLTQEGELFWPDAHYFRGRILFALRQYSAAESALGIALRQFKMSSEPLKMRAKLMHRSQLARCYYWHGRAVQELVRQDLLKAAEIDFREYLRLGAPCGDAARAKSFLTERETTAQPAKSKAARKVRAKKNSSATS